MTKQELIHQYLDGGLDAVQEDILFAELASDPTLRVELQEQMRLHQLAKSDMASSVVSPELSAAVFSAVGVAIPGSAPSSETSDVHSARNTRWWTSPAALLVLGALSSVVVLRLLPSAGFAVLGAQPQSGVSTSTTLSVDQSLSGLSSASNQTGRTGSLSQYTGQDAGATHTIAASDGNTSANLLAGSVATARRASAEGSGISSRLTTTGKSSEPLYTKRLASGNVSSQNKHSLAPSLATNDQVNKPGTSLFDADLSSVNPTKLQDESASLQNALSLTPAVPEQSVKPLPLLSPIPMAPVPEPISPSFIVEARVRPFAMLFPDVDQAERRRPDIDNMSLLFAMHWGSEHIVGIEFGREEYSTSISEAAGQGGPIGPGAEEHHEHSSLFSIGVRYRYEPMWAALMRGGIQPYVGAYAGGVEHGARFDVASGLRLFAQAPLSMVIGLNYTTMFNTGAATTERCQALGMQLGLQVQW